jgi:hypothetical protein
MLVPRTERIRTSSGAARAICSSIRRAIRRLEYFFEEHGGIADVLLIHHNDVCDADKYAARFASGAWIHDPDLRAGPFASDIVTP